MLNLKRLGNRETAKKELRAFVVKFFGLLLLAIAAGAGLGLLLVT
ncbi:MAG: hypothetical protein OXK76_07565 [Gammaproteobacteria bacterium]|nr:hypothetical protein [Gammaproteobacteria bacterium]